MRDIPHQGAQITRTGPPTRSYTGYKPARPLSDWISEGQVAKGHEANGTAFTYDVLDSLNRHGPREFVVVGETRYDDGRYFLEFGINREFVEANSDFRDFGGKLEWVCPVCEGRGEEHRKVDIKGQMVKCPRDTRGRR